MDPVIRPPILEFDPAATAVLEPIEIHAARDIPSAIVLCFFQEVIERVVREHNGRRVAEIRFESAFGPNPIYEIDYGGRRLGLVHPGVGAPLAVGQLEAIIAYGGRAFVACGGAGALVPGLTLGHVIVPTGAVRDEGTSYHYLPADQEATPSQPAVEAILATLDHHAVPYVTGRTWTTDAIYRETRGKLERRVAQGCIAVDMEAAAFFAVAAFRGVQLASLLYAGDDLSGDGWDERGWDAHTSGRELLFRIAAESVLRL